MGLRVRALDRQQACLFLSHCLPAKGTQAESLFTVVSRTVRLRPRRGMMTRLFRTDGLHEIARQGGRECRENAISRDTRSHIENGAIICASTP